MESGAEEEYQSLDLTHKYFAAIQITRPKSASKTGIESIKFHSHSLLLQFSPRFRPQDLSLAKHQ